MFNNNKNFYRDWPVLDGPPPERPPIKGEPKEVPTVPLLLLVAVLVTEEAVDPVFEGVVGAVATPLLFDADDLTAGATVADTF